MTAATRPARGSRSGKSNARKASRPALHRTAATRAPGKRRSARVTPQAAASRGLAARALRLAGVGSQAVLRATGRAWDEWIRVLDRAGAQAMPHRDIALLVAQRFSLPGWWSQRVTVGYEQARGMRAPGRRGDGHMAHASRTVRIDMDKLHTAWSEPLQRSRWLPGAPVEVRRATDGRSMRMTWTAGESSVDVSFASKGPGWSVVQVEHGRIADEPAASRQKAYWGEALARLKTLLEGKP